MKVIFIIVICIVVLIVLLQLVVVMQTNKTEHQKYSLVHKYKDFEIRFYPAVIISTISLDAKSYSDLSGPGFRKLVTYIFGGNATNKKIAMTTPVQMEINDSAAKMNFVMPTDYTKENLPKPNDPNVRIENTEDEHVAVIRFGGYASDADLKRYTEKLKELLKENGITSYGNYRFFGYNPPYQIISRRNEIVVSVEWKE